MTTAADGKLNEQAVTAYLAELPDDPAELAAKAADAEDALSTALRNARTYRARMEGCITAEARSRNARRFGNSVQYARMARELLEAIRRKTATTTTEES